MIKFNNMATYEIEDTRTNEHIDLIMSNRRNDMRIHENVEKERTSPVRRYKAEEKVLNLFEDLNDNSDREGNREKLVSISEDEKIKTNLNDKSNITSNDTSLFENKNISPLKLDEIEYSIENRLIPTPGKNNHKIRSKSPNMNREKNKNNSNLNDDLNSKSNLNEKFDNQFQTFKNISTVKKEKENETLFFDQVNNFEISERDLNKKQISNETIRLSNASNSKDFFSIKGFNNFAYNCDDKDIRYDRKNIHNGKDFFKFRFISENILKDKRARELRRSKKFTNNSSINTSIQNLAKNNNTPNAPVNKLNFVHAPDDKKVIKLNKLFLQKLEKSIFLFNIKSYEESFNYLLENKLIKDEVEFAELLLLTPGFDKNIIGSFLSSDKYPNKNFKVLEFFIKKINFTNVKFTEAIRFLLTRLNLPKDSSMILKIIEMFSNIFYIDNKDSKIFPDEDAVYLLCSTVLALNTFISRKDLKNIKTISKLEFIKMNHRISQNIIAEIYDDISSNKLDVVYDYNEMMYKRLAVVLDKEVQIETTPKGVYIQTDYEDEERTKRINQNININININVNKEDNRQKENLSNTNDVNNGFNAENINHSDSSLLQILKKGEIFLKYGRYGTPHLKHVRLSDDGTKLMWKNKSVCSKIFSKSKFILVDELKDVYIGTQNSKIFERYRIPLEYDRFCITIESSGRTLDLRKDNEEICNKWYNGIKSLITNIYNNRKEEKFKNNLSNVKNLKSSNQIAKNHLTLDSSNDEVSFIWKNEILPKWKDFRIFVQLKMNFYNTQIVYTKKKKYFEEKIKYISINPKSSLNSKILNESEKSDFIFFYSYYGIPSWLRKNLYSILIKNAMNVSEILFNKFSKNVEKINFNFNNSTESYKGIIQANGHDTEFIYDKEEILNSSSNSIIETNSNIFTVKEILADVEKTFKKFKSQIISANKTEKDFKQDLFKILRIFSFERGDLPYSKNLAYIATIFLLNSENYYKAYVLFVNFVCNHCDFLFKFQIRDDFFIKTRIDFFEKLFQSRLPKLFKHFKSLDIQTSLFFYDWFEYLFIKCFNRTNESFKFYQKIFDIFLIRGEVFLYEFGIGLIQIQQRDLLSDSVKVCLRHLKKFPFDTNGKFTEEKILDCLSEIDYVQEFKNFTEENILATEKGNLWESLLNY